MSVVLYCEMDRTIVIRAGPEGWTGYSSCTLIIEYSHVSCLMPRHLINLCHSFDGIEASNIDIANFSTFYHTWGSHWKARTPTDRWRSLSLDGTDIKRCVDGERGGQQLRLLLHDGQDGERGERAGLTLRSDQS